MKKILMCEPTYFRVDYVINPWMKPGSVDQPKALQQWTTLKETYESLGVEVEVISQRKDLPDMVFAADQGVVRNKKILLSNFSYKERQGETQVYAHWFATHGYQIQHLEQSSCEGGELLGVEGKYFLGTGFRAQSCCVPQLSAWLSTPVTELDLIDSRFYHLDTCFFPLNASTVFYYPAAFSPQALKKIPELFRNAIEFSEEEVLGFCANSVRVGKHVLTQKGVSSFEKKLEKLGYTVHALDMSEFVKSGGGIHCLTLELEA